MPTSSTSACGNDSPYKFEAVRRGHPVVGLDVVDYNQSTSRPSYADEYLSVPADGFLAAIRERPNQFDAVVSSHNLEHCHDPDGVVTAMARALRLRRPDLPGVPVRGDAEHAVARRHPELLG